MKNLKFGTAALHFFIVGLSQTRGCSGFVPQLKLKRVYKPRKEGSTIVTQKTLTEMSLAKKRRRKKDDSSSSSSQQRPSTSSPSEELPEFDLSENDENPPKKSNPISSNPDEISDAMMGSPNKPTRSIDELISDRSLEKKFQFDDEPENDSLPDLAAIAKQQSGSGGNGNEMGRKRSKQGARIAAAKARKAVEEEEANPLKNIPFITDEDGEVSVLKILETGTWVGIGLLVLWEIYINSPLFDRQAPLAPFIYDIYL